MFAHMTVAENIALPLRYHFDWTLMQSVESVKKILELTGLETQAQSTASAMSGNWLQRVGLARALALKPEVLFLDEPLSGLESRHRQWWQSFLENLSTGLPWNDNRQVSVIIATNTPENWSAWGQQFARIDEGRWVSPIPGPTSAEPVSSKQPLSTPAASDAPHRQPGT
jgi:ABC-type Fe3+/spermidine/putrescine transport system ATPase subunit